MEKITGNELPTTRELYKKHFSEVYGGNGVGIFHPNMEAFFEELNQVCLMEDKIKADNLTNAYIQSLNE